MYMSDAYVRMTISLFIFIIFPEGVQFLLQLFYRSICTIFSADLKKYIFPLESYYNRSWDQGQSQSKNNSNRRHYLAVGRKNEGKNGPHRRGGVYIGVRRSQNLSRQGGGGLIGSMPPRKNAHIHRRQPVAINPDRQKSKTAPALP